MGRRLGHTCHRRSGFAVRKIAARGILHRVKRTGLCSIASRLKETESVLLADVRSSIYPSLKRCFRHLNRHLLERADGLSQISQEKLLQDVAQRFPRCKPFVSAIPVMVDLIPEDLRQDLAMKAKTKTFKVAFLLLENWVK